MTTPAPIPTQKLMLAVVTGGVLLGALGGQLTNPVMKFAEEPEWRTRYESRFSATPEQFVEAGPEDLSPVTWFGPVYAEPAVFAPQNTAIPDYLPVTESEGYATDDAPEQLVAPEVDRASAAAASTAADLTGGSAAIAQNSNRLPSDTLAEPAAPDLAPPNLAPADQTS